MPFTIVHKEISVKFYKRITKQHPLLLLLSFISPCNSFNVKVMFKDLKLYWFPIKVWYFDIGTFKPNNYETGILYLTNRWYLNHLNYISDTLLHFVPMLLVPTLILLTCMSFCALFRHIESFETDIMMYCNCL